ncbi:MAG: YggU family protein [Acidobacteriota bacterium]|nr:MAG: YggU family protein [Acidobacteriota bacterium]
MPAAENSSVRINVRVVPRASRSEVVGMQDGVLRVRIAAPPVDGAANEELIRVLAKHFSTRKSSIEIVSGETSKNKIVRITGLAGDVPNF